MDLKTKHRITLVEVSKKEWPLRELLPKGVKVIGGSAFKNCKSLSSISLPPSVDEIETAVFNMEQKEIPSHVIGELVMTKLKELDQVAYVRFASVYRDFREAKDFKAFISSLEAVAEAGPLEGKENVKDEN